MAHFADAHVDGIKQGGAALGDREHQLSLNVLNRLGEVRNLIRFVRKVIMKNSSCGLAVLKNSITASRARSIFVFMLPLKSKITPMDTGASSAEKISISCGDLPSNI